MSKRGWKAVESIHSPDGSYCVDLFIDADDRFGFAEFRADVEDGGSWTLVRQSSDRFDSRDQAEAEAKAQVGWLSAI